MKSSESNQQIGTNAITLNGFFSSPIMLKGLVVWFLGLLLLPIVASCQKKDTQIPNEKSTQEKKNLGEYVFRDNTNCIHFNQHCFALLDENGENYQIRFAKVDTLSSISMLCSICSTPRLYEQLDSIVKINQSIQQQN